MFCNNDDLALGVLFECHRAFIDVPQTIGIAGFNDLDMMQAAYPVAHQRAHAIATRSAGGRSRWRGRAIDGQAAEQPVVDIGFELKPRESTARRQLIDVFTDGIRLYM